MQAASVTILAVAAAVLILLFVFRMNSLEIVGASRTSPEKIENDLVYNFWTGNTVFFTWKYKDATADSRAPYLGSIQAKMKSPGTVVLTVTEKRLLGAVEYGKQFVCFDDDGVVLEIDEKKPANVPLIEGMTVDEPALYQKLPVANTAQLTAVLSTSRLLENADLIPDTIRLDENLNITAVYGDIEVELGMNELLEEKVAYLGSIYPSLKDETGVLHMETYTGNNESFTFSPGKPGSEETEEAKGLGPGGAAAGMDPEGSQGAVQEEAPEAVAGPVFQAFDAYGNLHNDAQVVNGQVVDSNGTPLEGCTVNEDGSVTDAYWNVMYDVVPAGTTQPAEETGAQGAAEEAAEPEPSGETVGLSAFMVFDSSGTLRYDAHVVGGQVVDAYGSPIPGCSLNADGYVVDAYMNVIDPNTGTLAQ